MTCAQSKTPNITLVERIPRVEDPDGAVCRPPASLREAGDRSLIVVAQLHLCQVIQEMADVQAYRGWRAVRALMFAANVRTYQLGRKGTMGSQFVERRGAGFPTTALLAPSHHGFNLCCLSLGSAELVARYSQSTPAIVGTNTSPTAIICNSLKIVVLSLTLTLLEMVTSEYIFLQGRDLISLTAISYLPGFCTRQ